MDADSAAIDTNVVVLAVTLLHWYQLDGSARAAGKILESMCQTQHR